MERIILRMLFISSVAAIPFVIKRKSLFRDLTVFFAKGILSTSIDSIFIKSKKVEYPVRPFPKIFDTNILFDLLFFPLLSVIWVKWTYHSKPSVTILRSLVFSVPMSITQWIMERKTKLFKWKAWSVYHTFISINFTLFTIRGMAEILKKMAEKKIPLENNTSTHSLNSHEHTQFKLYSKLRK